MLKIRLKRAGSKGRPFYRVVVMDSRQKRDGRSVEDIGYYNPLENPAVVNIDRDKVTHWVGLGAQLSDSVNSMLKRENSVHQSRRNPAEYVAAAPTPKKPKKGEAAEKAAPVVAAVAVAEAPAPAPAEAAPEAQAAEAPAPEAPAAETAPAEDAEAKTEE